MGMSMMGSHDTKDRGYVEHSLHPMNTCSLLQPDCSSVFPVSPFAISSILPFHQIHLLFHQIYSFSLLCVKCAFAFEMGSAAQAGLEFMILYHSLHTWLFLVSGRNCCVQPASQNYPPVKSGMFLLALGSYSRAAPEL